MPKGGKIRHAAQSLLGGTYQRDTPRRHEKAMNERIIAEHKPESIEFDPNEGTENVLRTYYFLKSRKTHPGVGGPPRTRSEESREPKQKRAESWRALFDGTYPKRTYHPSFEGGGIAERTMNERIRRERLENTRDADEHDYE